MIGWLLNVLGALSQFLNSFWGGDRDQSFSSRSWEAKISGRWWGGIAVAVVDALFWFQPDHCRRAYESDSERTYTPDN